MHQKDSDIVEILRKKLSKEHRSWLWSCKDIKEHDISDKLLVEKYLGNGRKEDWELLKRAFKRQFIRSVWLKNGGAYGSMNNNHAVASYFFNIKNPEKYQERKHRENINKFAKG
jgi:hypothetical protein